MAPLFSPLRLTTCSRRRRRRELHFWPIFLTPSSLAAAAASWHGIIEQLHLKKAVQCWVGKLIIQSLSISSRNISISPREAFDFRQLVTGDTLYFDIPILGLGETKRRPILSVEIERACGRKNASVAANDTSCLSE